MSTLVNINISATSGPITIKCYLNHHLGEGKVALGFGSDRNRTLVSMTTDCSYRGKSVTTLAHLFLIEFYSASVCSDDISFRKLSGPLLRNC